MALTCFCFNSGAIHPFILVNILMMMKTKKNSITIHFNDNKFVY